MKYKMLRKETRDALDQALLPVLASIKLASMGQNDISIKNRDRLVGDRSYKGEEYPMHVADSIGESLLMLAEYRRYLTLISRPHAPRVYQLTMEGNALATTHPAVLRESIRVLNLAVNAKVDK
jgi:hypothetical protein